MTSNKTFLYAAVFLIVLVGCFVGLSAQTQPTPTANSDLYKYSILRLAKGTIVDSVDGKYIAIEDERWFTETQCVALQRENANLHFMLQQSRHLRQ